MYDTEPLFDGPIPGMSLTADLGGRPWQQPAQYTTVDEAIQYYMDRMTTEEFMDEIVTVLELGVPITSIANTIQLASIMEGLHSVDVGVLVTPVLIEMLMFIGDSAGVEYDAGLDDPDKDVVSKSKMAKVMSKFSDDINAIEEDEKVEVETVAEPTEEPTSTGIMGRRK
tara:strand:- start:237 stop:743 length:507 start_codon:yes stop_codon:yes gene_type:complete